VFVTLEGIGGAGKTTQAALLGEALESQGRRVLVTHEPGSTPLGERLRHILLEEDEMSPWTEAALFAAARAELVAAVIRPALDLGFDVVCDRYVDSSLAYQGIGRRLGVENVLELNLRTTEDLLPDRTFFLRLDPEEARRRREKVDRIEHGDHEFAIILDRAYRELATRFPDRIVTVDAAQPVPDVAALIRDRVRDLS
jgi:dTMP kinase